jgi:hypothetical protein
MTIGSYLVDLSMLLHLSINFSCLGLAKEMIAARNGISDRDTRIWVWPTSIQWIKTKMT